MSELPSVNKYRTTPENINQLYTDRFLFTLVKIPNASWHSIEANLPGVQIAQLDVAAPTGKWHVAGEPTWEPFTMTFRVDEDLSNYIELFNWMQGIGAYESTDQFKALAESTNYPLITSNKRYPIYSDGTLITLTNTLNYNLKVVYKDMFPMSLTGLNFNQLSNDQVLTATVTFSYMSYSFQ